ncbi:IS3 family transposase [Modestobacter sp. Leaf380]|uniref:IS3 family transposase n=1 Tax=Modestobacter sp. Leaf380 TaxID=1736356 RepID=UPI000B305CD1|nr:IS3 family transposase [Modestobacter sp. Leaf380]
MHPATDLVGALGRARHRAPARAPGARGPGAPGVHRRCPNKLWLTDITEHPTAEGKLYLCAIEDACTKRIVGYSIDARMASQLAVDALTNALALRGEAGAIVHSDRGSQVRSHAYVAALRDAQLQGSMGRVGTSADNAAMESFFALQKNVLNRRRWTTRDQLRLAIVTWIETTYHRRRRQDTLGRLTPIEFDTLTHAAHAA